MENARDTLGGNCAGAESAFPTAPWTPPQAAPTGTTGILLDAHLLDSTSRISTRRCNPDGRQLTDERRYAPMSVHLRRNLRSRSPESVFTFAEIATHARQSGNHRETTASRRKSHPRGREPASENQKPASTESPRTRGDPPWCHWTKPRRPWNAPRRAGIDPVRE